MIHIGTSGWQYDSWRGRFYPKDLPQSDWLPFFASRFETVEVNNTFYRLPKRETFVRWREQTPPGFVVTVKASRFITHIKRLKEPQEPIRTLYERAEGLGERLGPVLYQLPPRFRAVLVRLEAFLDALPRHAPAAIEFRDPTWNTEEVWRLLDEHGAAFVLADRPGARVHDIVTGGWSYIRFHQGQRHSPHYRRGKLRRWAERITRLSAHDVFIYFNNDHDGAAVHDAETIHSLLSDIGARVATNRNQAKTPSA
ncbi:MAG: DUF72 domain-containing protein [Actinomycetota bacterium]